MPIFSLTDSLLKENVFAKDFFHKSVSYWLDCQYFRENWLLLCYRAFAFLKVSFCDLYLVTV